MEGYTSLQTAISTFLPLIYLTPYATTHTPSNVYTKYVQGIKPTVWVRVAPDTRFHGKTWQNEYIREYIAVTRSALLSYPPFLGQHGGASNALKAGPRK